MTTDYRYPWPASALGRKDMELLHAVRENTSPRVPITRLIAEAVNATTGRTLRPAPSNNNQPKGKHHER